MKFVLLILLGLVVGCATPVQTSDAGQTALTYIHHTIPNSEDAMVVNVQSGPYGYKVYVSVGDEECVVWMSSDLSNPVMWR